MEKAGIINYIILLFLGGSGAIIYFDECFTSSREIIILPLLQCAKWELNNQPFFFTLNIKNGLLKSKIDGKLPFIFLLHFITIDFFWQSFITNPNLI